uniref:Uncharacterized protein n=1 Tax=Parascaris univalens TaxID=6257 RepID=A0A915C8L5_PARUN
GRVEGGTSFTLHSIAGCSNQHSHLSMDGHRFYSSPNMGTVDQWSRNTAMDGAINFQPNGFRHTPNVYMPRNSNQWSESAGGAAAKSWSQQGPRDEYKER